MENSCEFFSDLICLEGDLDPQEELRLDEHLRRCTSCTELQKEQNFIDELLRKQISLNSLPAPGALEDLEKRILSDLNLAHDSETESVVAEIKNFKNRNFVPNYFKTVIEHRPEKLRENWENIKRYVHRGFLGQKLTEILVFCVSHINQCQYCSYVHKLASLTMNPELSEKQLGVLASGGFIDDFDHSFQRLLGVVIGAAKRAQGLDQQAIWQLSELHYSPEQIREVQSLMELIFFMNETATKYDVEIDRQLLVS